MWFESRVLESMLFSPCCLAIAERSKKSLQKEADSGKAFLWRDPQLWKSSSSLTPKHAVSIAFKTNPFIWISGKEQGLGIHSGKHFGLIFVVYGFNNIANFFISPFVF